MLTAFIIAFYSFRGDKWCSSLKGQWNSWLRKDFSKTRGTIMELEQQVSLPWMAFLRLKIIPKIIKLPSSE